MCVSCCWVGTTNHPEGAREIRSGRSWTILPSQTLIPRGQGKAAQDKGVYKGLIYNRPGEGGQPNPPRGPLVNPGIMPQPQPSVAVASLAIHRAGFGSSGGGWGGMGVSHEPTIRVDCGTFGDFIHLRLWPSSIWQEKRNPSVKMLEKLPGASWVILPKPGVWMGADNADTYIGRNTLGPSSRGSSSFSPLPYGDLSGAWTAWEYGRGD